MATWDIADIGPDDIADLLGLGPGVVVGDPSIAPYFVSPSSTSKNIVVSSDNLAATLSLNFPVNTQFTAEIEVRFDSLPNSTGDLDEAHAGLVVADDGGRGFAMYFARTGLAVSPIDNFGSVTPLPDTTAVTREATEAYRVIRIAVDGDLGRAYIYTGDAATYSLQLRYIVPVEASGSVSDLFRLIVKGSATSPVAYRVRALRLSSGLVGFTPPPVALSGPDRVVAVGGTARLDGRGSYAFAQAPLTYAWRVLDVPFGSQYAADVSGGSTVPDLDDGYTNTVTFPVGNLPEWLGVGDILQFAGVPYDITDVDHLTGEVVVDGDLIPDTLSGAPFRVLRSSVLLYSNTATPVVVPDVQGVYRFALTVSDGLATSEPSEALVNIVGARAPRGVEPDVTPMWSMLGDEWHFVKNRGVFEEAWRGVAQLMGAMLLEAWQYHYNFSLRDAQGTFQRRWLDYQTVVRDGTFSGEYRLHTGYVDLPYFLFNDFLSPSEAFDGIIRLEMLVDGETVVVDTDFAGIGGDTIGNGINVRGYFAEVDGELRVYLLLISDYPLRIAENTEAEAFPFTGEWSSFRGENGQRITDRVYRVQPGTPLPGVGSGDYLVLDGVAYRIERVLPDPDAVLEGAYDDVNVRLLLSDELPLDAPSSWSIPSIIRGEADYSPVAPGDSVEVEGHLGDAITTYVSTVVATAGGLLLVHAAGGLVDAHTAGAQLYLVGVRLHSRLPLRDGTLSIPALQDKIPVASSPTLWEENLDYVIEVDETGGATLLFREPQSDLPDVLWAELTILSNNDNLENTFGRIAGLSVEQARSLGPDFNYLAGISGLFYAQQRGPNVDAMRSGAQILLGQPFAEVTGTILEILPEFSPTRGRVLVQDADGNEPSQSEIVRSYLYKKDPLDLESTSGLAENPDTGEPWAVGDTIGQFRPIGAGVSLTDIYNDPEWYYPLVRSGLMSEIEKFHTFAVRFNLDLVTTVNMPLLAQFLDRTKPHFDKPLLLGTRSHVEDVDAIDVLAADVGIDLFDSFNVEGPSFFYDEIRSDGTYWNHHDDGVIRYDAYADYVTDIIDLDFIMEWPGGIITGTDVPYGGDLFFATDVVDVDGTQGPPGGTFVPTDGMNLAAGEYRFTSIIKSTGVVPPWS